MNDPQYFEFAKQLQQLQARAWDDRCRRILVGGLEAIRDANINEETNLGELVSIFVNIARITLERAGMSTKGVDR